MTKEERKNYFHLVEKTTYAVEAVAKALHEFHALIPYVTMLTGAISDLSDTIGSDPQRSLQHLQAIKAVKQLQKSARRQAAKARR
jgi:hypothetical protein